MKLPAESVKAIADGDLESLQSILSDNPEVLNAVDEDDRSLLHHAVLTHKHALLQWLLDQVALNLAVHLM